MPNDRVHNNIDGLRRGSNRITISFLLGFGLLKEYPLAGVDARLRIK